MFLLDYNNIYWKKDPQKFNIFYHCIQEHWRHYEVFLKNHYSEVVAWIDESLPYLSSSFYKFNTKAHWILNGLTSFPRCKECGREMNDKNVRSLKDGYKEFCSCRCAARSDEKKAAIATTSLKEWGVSNPMKNEELKILAQDKFEAKHGARTPMQVPQFKKNFEESMLKNHGGRYTFECPDLVEKVDATNMKNYGTIHPSQTLEVKIRTAESFLKSYGATNNMKTERGIQEVCSSNRKKYGYDWASQDPEIRKKISQGLLNIEPDRKEEIREHIKATLLRDYGYDHIWKVPEVREAIKQTNIENFGVPYPAQSPEIMKKIIGGSYVYRDLRFSSLPELAFYIWLKDNSIEFEYQPSTPFEYEYDGKKFKYFPDFKVGEKYYELKGDHFFKDDGTMFLPYRKKSWSDEKYEWMCKKYEAKHQCMIANGVVILTSHNYQLYLTYVSEKYGRDYLKQFKRS